MSTFDLFVVGCGGGPFEDNLSSYLLKPKQSSWNDGIVALEAGSGLGALNRLLTEHIDVFSSASEDDPASATSAAGIHSWIKCYLVTHAHLDHINGLVLSAGSSKGPPKLIHGTQKTLEIISDVFSGKLWPSLASWTKDPDKPYLLSPLSPEDGYTSVSSDISVRTMEVSHGLSDASSDTPYPSSAYFIRHDPTSHELLFFGDVEPDKISSRPQNLEIWRIAAPKIPHALSALFIECSWPDGRAEDLLYGHLSPTHLVEELTVLAREVARSRGNSDEDEDADEEHARRRKRRRESDSQIDVHGALVGLSVYIIHCKDDLQGAFDKPIQEVIAEQVRDLVIERDLGAEIIAVEQGMLICESLSPSYGIVNC
ncbi:cyclic-AMP phosphodiesterase [Trametes meyenii]|nr:cyclic-AMP phosphodiesterase [Trametes meyenii]